MSSRNAGAGRSPRFILALLAPAVAAAVLLGLAGGATQRASGAAGEGEVAAQTDASVPARAVIMMGSSPLEAPDETWGIGQVGSISTPSRAIVRYAEGAGWSQVPMLDSHERPLAQFVPAGESALAGQLTPTGAGALLGTVTEVNEEAKPVSREVLLMHNPGNPGGAFREVETVPSALLPAGETLSGGTRAPLLAPLDEGGGLAGALVVPVGGSGSALSESGVLHWDGHTWTREEIEIPAAAKEGFRVLAIGASSPSNAWLLGQLPSGGVALFQRHGTSEASWKPVAPSPTGTPGEALSAEGESFAVPGEGQPPTVKTQVLTVTEEGVWVDGERTDAHTLMTMFFKPAGEGKDSGQVSASWCDLPAGVPVGTHSCTYTLPESLPSGFSRSFAWANSSAVGPAGPYGQRVITGLPGDVSLRLEGTSFARVLALGAEGGSLGAAFSSPREGWLGDGSLPVHLTLHPIPSRLESYPVPFRYALLAVAPEPGAPVGALSSQALAVGDNGEVARYAPGEGWEPESLLGPGGRRETPRLRAVAWPSAGRAYAVGELGQMWLWRAETGLWEPDPAAPRNFRGDLLGIAFDPANPGVGYAVGQQGVLLRYGKSWSQEALPPEVAGASFTSIAFSRSEAIVAYRLPHPASATPYYSGGLLVNSGSGWHVDPAAAAALAPGESVPWAVAGLPDGGAALSGETRSEEPLVLERNGPGAAWEPTATPYPYSTRAPGSIALFREGGALRAIGSGTIPNTRETDFFEPPAPAGLPENLIKPYPPTSGHVLRQTASGWSDEEHERNESVNNPGDYAFYDNPYEPDPTAAVLTDPTGSQGWAVGGEIETVGQGVLDTADIARYPAESTPPPGVGSAPIQANTGEAVFAIAGNAQCSAPCADRQNDRLGPDVWLSTALGQAAAIPGVRDFMYLGPRVTSGRTVSGKVTQEVPYEREFQRYAGLLQASPLPALPVVSSTDLAGGTGECLFDHTFGDFDFPGALSGAPSEPCSAQSAYYSFESPGPAGSVRVIVLDEASRVGAAQLAWLRAQLEEAANHSPEPEPAIVLGEADLNAQIAAREAAAIELASVLVKKGGASAYFYNAPERNIQLPLRVGSESIPTFGTGSLGYVLATNSVKPDFIGHSGFLLAEVNAHPTARDATTLRWPVTARLIPNIGELALEAQDGVLLHRSQAALFDGLARRPRAGCRVEGGGSRPHCETSPYIPIPANCVGAACANGIFPEYTFSSSRPEIGEFVEPNLASDETHAVLLGPNEKPIADPKSGLFCAYNAGTTVVTISAGGLSSSLPVTVQAGSVRRPCGTQPLKVLPPQPSAGLSPPPAPAPTPAAASPAPTSSPPPIPLPPPPPPPPPLPPAAAPRPHPTPAAFFLPPALAAPVLAFLPAPVPTPARPTPPSGTSAVTSPVEVAEREEEEEEATESVSNQALAYRAPDHEPVAEYLLGLILLAALAGASVRRRPRRGRREVRVAPATLSAMRSQRRFSSPRRRGNRW